MFNFVFFFILIIKMAKCAVLLHLILFVWRAFRSQYKIFDCILDHLSYAAIFAFTLKLYQQHFSETGNVLYNFSINALVVSNN